MAPRMSTWDHKSDKDLLLTIIELGQSKSILWPAIANHMAANGYTFTKEACRQHFQKIRRESKSGAGGDDDDEDPQPKAGASKAASKPAPRKRAAKAQESFAAGSMNGEDDEEDMGKPAKRQRKVKPEGSGGEQQTAPVFKKESGSGNGLVDLENDDIYDADDPESGYV